MFSNNIILATDSYKASHFKVLPPGTTAMHFYVESRGGKFGRAVVFGLQAYLRSYLFSPVTRENVEEAADFFGPHGEPFNREGWEHILDKHGGYLPLVIRGVDEGTVLPAHNAMATVENTDPVAHWLPGYIETGILRGIWYPTTVATISWHAKAKQRNWLNLSCDTPDEVIPFMLHDFGGRGVSSGESAALGGMAHLVNYMGSDTVEGVLAAKRFYNEPMAGFSIPAAEHSTVTSWGRERETEAYRAHLAAWGGKGKLMAVVSDSYDLWNAIQNLWGGELRAEVLATGGRLVIRPDSGEPAEVVLKAVQMLDGIFGSEVNHKGYRVLNPAVRIVQGDGINLDTIDGIYGRLTNAGYSAENVALGMGGGLLQHCNRDDLGFAMKGSARRDEAGAWHGFNKAPVTDLGKQSKKGRQMLLREGMAFHTVSYAQGDPGENILRPRYRDGTALNETTFAEVRARAAAGLRSCIEARDCEPAPWPTPEGLAAVSPVEDMLQKR